MSFKHTILCVDDEEYNLDALRRVLRKDYEVLTALSGAEGLELLQTHQVSLIVSDQRMPRMSGVEFLEKSIELCPGIVRIILTGFTDVDDLIGAINTGRVYRYINKPWDPNDLLITVKRALENLELTIENRRLLDDVVRLEKLATVGQVASGINHEVRNQLSVLMGVQLIQQMHPDDELINKVSNQVVMARDRILTILNEIKSYGKQTCETLKQESIAVSKLLVPVLSILEFDPETKHIQYEITNPDDPCFICDQDRIIQVLINLLRNAAHAMNGEGSVIIEVNSNKKEITINIIDTGCGIPTDIQDKIWQPFFTTKGEKGTGLGLAITKRIIEAHNGNLSFKSEEGKGSTFIIRLPVKEDIE